jgi:nitrite reductase/ring-hydroxylating ferredoxin subunit
MFAVPVEYLFRPPQNVLWTSTEKGESEPARMREDTARRHFLNAAAGILAGLLLFSIGAFDKIFKFFFGPRLTREQETEILEARLTKLQDTVSERKLELERQSSNYILIGKLSELKRDRGKYFIDYLMKPAIAFEGDDGLPILISAQCTHLGCTVGNEVSDGKILCPCHVSYFDIKTGEPNANAPAKKPLPHLGWVLIDGRGNILMSRTPDGSTAGSLSEDARAEARVYIAKSHAEKA